MIGRRVSQFGRYWRKKISNKVEEKINQSLGAVLQLTSQKDFPEQLKKQIDATISELRDLGLDKLKDSQIRAEMISRQVLEKAEELRQQVVATPYAPDWLKEIAFTLQGPLTQTKAASANGEAVAKAEESTRAAEANVIHPDEISAEASASLTETTISEPAAEMIPQAIEIKSMDIETEPSDESSVNSQIEGSPAVNGKNGKTPKSGRTKKNEISSAKSSTTRAPNEQMDLLRHGEKKSIPLGRPSEVKTKGIQSMGKKSKPTGKVGLAAAMEAKSKQSKKQKKTTGPKTDH